MSTNQSIKNPNVSTLGAVKYWSQVLPLITVAVIAIGLGCAPPASTPEAAQPASGRANRSGSNARHRSKDGHLRSIGWITIYSRSTP